MKHIRYQDFLQAIKILKLISKTDRKKVKNQYLKLSKIYHPDMQGGDTSKFQELNDAYKLVVQYMDNYRFDFSKDEFKEQYPFSDKSEGDWLYSV
ncbi:MAG: DnaJ domain-containing protein [Arcobacteraceae bacterium]|jgi:DnaJ-class molecular chaperone|nr:DnaJ domain-containing protein [Arcobacteraceae bacterium]MDY0364898.1 DnaJ domain-containing protein [Arcobacteraceae bacterium]